jgi:glycine/D-amino acid oxidase-like deaminating enzyme/nitrite reductase/ring-hydroxylating ferredoxin subunit
MDNKTSIPNINLAKDPESYWIASTPRTNYPTLEKDISVDVAIVGGGLVGISTGYFLKKAGYRVAVIEADRIGQGTTGHTTAKITSQHGLKYNKIKQDMGEELARQYADANETAIRTMEEIIKTNNIECDFEHRSSYVYTHSDQYVQKIMDEANTSAALGINAHYLDTTPLPFEVKAAVRFDNQAQFHPLKYLLSIAATIPENGSHIFEQTRAIDIHHGNPNMIITKNGHKVSANFIVIASHYPFYDGLGFYFARVYQSRSYALGVRINDKFPDGMYITAEDPTRSLRSQRYDGGEIVIVGGEHHKTGHGKDTMTHYKNLRDFAVATFNVNDIPFRWSTQDCETMDKVPFVGLHRAGVPNIYVATGFKKWGMTNSTASAMILRDLIVEGRSPWQDVYNPLRRVPAARAEFIKENLDVAVNFVSGKLFPRPENFDIKPGEAQHVEIEGQKVGAYKDEQGDLHIVDTTCTHLGCELQWNNAEKTWDCPCHGSRFNYEGDIVEGPAHHPLKHFKQGNNVIDPNFV